MSLFVHDAMFDFILSSMITSKLYGCGSIGYVSKSRGGMSNKLDNILTLITKGTYEGIAVGGDPGATFIDHLLCYEQGPVHFLIKSVILRSTGLLMRVS